MLYCNCLRLCNLLSSALIFSAIYSAKEKKNVIQAELILHKSILACAIISQNYIFCNFVFFLMPINCLEKKSIKKPKYV
jgi:hypothetical protein